MGLDTGRFQVTYIPTYVKNCYQLLTLLINITLAIYINIINY